MNKIYLQRIGANIKRYRLEKNLKQEYIGRKVGLDKSEVSRIENGQINIGVITLFKIAEAIEINVTLLFD
jgi:HTH-type transcriptional regulator/antitoxin HipB